MMLKIPHEHDKMAWRPRGRAQDGERVLLQDGLAVEDVGRVDGRVLRGIRTRQAIVSAARDLFITGEPRHGPVHRGGVVSAEDAKELSQQIDALLAEK